MNRDLVDRKINIDIEDQNKMAEDISTSKKKLFFFF